MNDLIYWGSAISVTLIFVVMIGILIVLSIAACCWGRGLLKTCKPVKYRYYVMGPEKEWVECNEEMYLHYRTFCPRIKSKKEIVN